MLSSTSFHVRLDVRDVPVEFKYDLESGEVTAFNSDLEVMAVGRTVADARSRFRSALLPWLLAELKSGNGLPAAIRTRIVEPEAESVKPAPRAQRSAS